MGKLNIKGRVKELIRLYDSLIFTQLSKKDSASTEIEVLNNGEMQIDYKGIYVGDSVTYLYLIEALPEKLEVSFRESIRSQCAQGVKVSFCTHMKGHKIEWNSPQMQRRLTVLAKAKENSEGDDVNVYNMYNYIGDMNKQDRVEKSLYYLITADKERGRSLFSISQLMLVSGTRGKDFDDSINSVEEYMDKRNFKYHRVMYNIPDVLKYYLPFSLKVSKESSNFVSEQVITDEILSRLSSYSQGKIGTRGIWFGNDVLSRFPVLKMVKKQSTDAENWLVCAETGGGKSYFVKGLIGQLLALGFTGTIMDIEGFEYIKMKEMWGKGKEIVIINMAEGQGKYFDPVEVPPLTGKEDIDKDLFNTANDYTLAVFKAIMVRRYDRDPWIDDVLNDTVARAYKDHGVSQDRSTWKNSKGMTLFTVYETLKKMVGYRKDEGYNMALEGCIATAGRYFEPDGTRRGVFAERVSLNEIIDADLAICSFGLKGKSENTIDSVQLALMQITASQISAQRTLYSWARGKFNFKVWEEIQRWGEFPGAAKTIGTNITGGRKMGDVNIIITNDVRKMLDDDKFSLMNNWTSLFCGALADVNVRRDLLERTSMTELRDALDIISTAKKPIIDEDGRKRGGSVFNYSFLCSLDRTEQCIVKMTIPPHLENSPLFKTGVEEDMKKLMEEG